MLEVIRFAVRKGCYLEPLPGYKEWQHISPPVIVKYIGGGELLEGLPNWQFYGIQAVNLHNDKANLVGIGNYPCNLFELVR